MIYLIKHYVWAFLFDQNAAKRFLIGLGSLVASAITAVLVFGFSTVIAWDSKTIWQHVAFALLTTLATMLPGPKIAKPDEKLQEILPPPRGYVRFALVMGVVCGVMQTLVLAVAFHGLGWNAHPLIILCFAGGAGQGWAVWRALK